MIQQWKEVTNQVDKVRQELAEIGIRNPEKAASLYIDYKNGNPEEQEQLAQHIHVLHNIATWVHETE